MFVKRPSVFKTTHIQNCSVRSKTATVTNNNETQEADV